MAKPDIKALLVDHFEKGIFAVVCLLTVAMLLGTGWVPYGHHPLEITQLVDQGEIEIAKRTWPAEEKQQFDVAEEESVEWLVANVRRQVDVTPYEFDQPFMWGIHTVTKPIEEAPVERVRALLAGPGRFLMGIKPEDPLLEETEDDPALMAEAETEDDQSEIPEEFRTRESVAGTLGGIAGNPAMLGSYGAESYDADYGESDYGDEYGAMGYGEESYGGSYGAAGMVSNMEGRGLRYVAVRGIIPLRDQIRKFMKALNIRSFTQASGLYQIIDFELQRKKMQPGDNPWEGEWETVDIEVAIDILNEALTFDPEVVPTAITDPVVTMPLPGRLMGIWKSKATHPQLENFTLSPEEIQNELVFNQMLVREWEEQEKNMPEAAVTRKGFTSVMGDARTMGMQAFNMNPMMGYGDESYGEDYGDEEGYGAASSYGAGASGLTAMMGMMNNYAPMSAGAMTPKAQEFINKLKKGLKAEEGFKDEKEREEALLEYIEGRVTAVGELLLFRYLDFDVEPGATYKYRTRLEVRNPNFGLPVARAGGIQSVVEGQTRMSDWSNETEPATVPYDVDYFVAKIEERRGRPSEAEMAVFQWNPDLGTTVFSRLDVSYGEEIGGPKETLVLDPAKNRFEFEPYKFHTGDVLVDALPQVMVSRLEHPDLELPKSAKRYLSISGQVLISKGNDELAVIDHRSRIPAFNTRVEYLGFEQQPYEDIKNKEAMQPDLSELQAYGEYGGDEESYGGGGEYGGMGAGMMMQMMMGGGGADDFGRGRRGGNALRKRSRSR